MSEAHESVEYKEEKRRANFEKTRAFNEEWRRKQDARNALGELKQQDS